MRKEYTIKSNSSSEEHSVVLEFNEDGSLNPEKTTCTCNHGSNYRFTKKNQELGKWRCAHVNDAVRKFFNKEEDNIERERREYDEKIREKVKPIHSIF